MNNEFSAIDLLRVINQRYGIQAYNFLNNRWTEYDEEIFNEALDKVPFEIIKNKYGSSLEIRFYQIEKRIVFELLVIYRTKHKKAEITSCNVLITIDDKVMLQFSEDFNVCLKDAIKKKCKEAKDIFDIIQMVVDFVKEGKYIECQ